MTARRSRRLATRANIALAASVPPALFLAALLAGGSGWHPIHTWFAVAVVALNAVSLACRRLSAATKPTAVVADSPRGDSPRVTHPRRPVLPTPIEVRK